MVPTRKAVSITVVISQLRAWGWGREGGIKVVEGTGLVLGRRGGRGVGGGTEVDGERLVEGSQSIFVFGRGIIHRARFTAVGSIYVRTWFCGERLFAARCC